MTLKRLRTILNAYGTDLARWPAAERASAEALLERSPEARTLLDEARVLDRLLDRAPIALPGLDPVAVAAAASAAAQPQPRREARSWRFSLWPQIVGIAAAGAIGLAVGWSGLAPGEAAHDPASARPGTVAFEEITLW